ncbi:MAG: HlyD family efflux transporter periplasmic adaptor subunit [Gammaproteobacteria bacterium]|nr:HlyD family efflux transporter periplasmic adaptor subunit [Gammaproteobacteria bacterium]MDH3447737.1 HlyD family efflux transporter periplasmic adaptor subunit [Gammaproteobacteria bacterium]
MRFLLTVSLIIGSTGALAIDLDGHTDFARRLELNSAVSARVEAIAVAVGQRVARGDLLLTLEATRLQADLDLARARADALAPRVERMLTELEKAQELFDRDSLAMVELQIAAQDHAIAEADLRAAQAELARAEYWLSQSEIRSPIDGIVLEISTFPGHYVNTRADNQTLAIVADNRTMHAKALLPIESWSDSLLNRAASVIFQKRRFDGKVVEIGHQVAVGGNNHPSTALIVEIRTDGKLPAALPVKITIADE